MMTEPKRRTAGKVPSKPIHRIFSQRNFLLSLGGYAGVMSRFDLARYVTPWKYRREQEARRVAELRRRDGDDCRRCRRPMRFDLPRGHDKGPRIEAITPGTDGEPQSLESLCLCHVRCNAAGADSTSEVTERMRRRNEAELLSRPRRAKKHA